MKKLQLLILIGVLLASVLYSQKIGEIFTNLKLTLFSHFYTETATSAALEGNRQGGDQR